MGSQRVRHDWMTFTSLHFTKFSRGSGKKERPGAVASTVEPAAKATGVEPCIRVTGQKSPELTKPHSNCCHESRYKLTSSLTPYSVKYPPYYPSYSILTSHLMPPFQQEFSLSWGYKNSLLAWERDRLSLEPAHSSNSISHLKKTLFSSHSAHAWKFFSSLHTDHDLNHDLKPYSSTRFIFSPFASVQ